AQSPAEQRRDRDALRLSGEVEAGNVDGCLRVRVALDHLVHALVDERDLRGIELEHGRDEVRLDEVLDGLGRLTVVAAMGAAPAGDRGRFAPAGDTVVRVEAKDGMVADRRLHLARPRVLAARGQGDEEYLAPGDLHQPAIRRSSAARVNGS